jgi:hypothetical protein
MHLSAEQMGSLLWRADCLRSSSQFMSRDPVHLPGLGSSHDCRLSTETDRLGQDAFWTSDESHNADTLSWSARVAICPRGLFKVLAGWRNSRCAPLPLLDCGARPDRVFSRNSAESNECRAGSLSRNLASGQTRSTEKAPIRLAS